jgi:uncharacterized protein involved in exopolysaccharide biosynthesis
LVRYDSPNTVDVVGYHQISPETFTGMLRSKELLDRISVKTKPHQTADSITDLLRVMPEHNSEIVAIGMAGKSAEDAVSLANLYATESIRYTQDMQSRDSAEVSQYLKGQLKEIDDDIANQQRAVLALGKSSEPTNQIASPEIEDQTTDAGVAEAAAPAAAPMSTFLTGRLEIAQQELVDLQTRYTDAHPLVQAQRARVQAIEQQIAVADSKAKAIRPAPSPVAAALVAAAPKLRFNRAGRLTATGPLNPLSDPEVLRSKFQSLENARVLLQGRLRASEAFEREPPGYFRLLAPATVKDVVVH